MIRAALFLLAAVLAFAQKPPSATFEGFPGFLAANDKLELTVLTRGAAMVNLVLRDDPGKLSPLWNPARMAREAGRKPSIGGMGHFLCLDGFGSVSRDERAAGLQGHGEAHTQAFEISRYEKEGNTLTIAITAKLPLVQEVVTRTLRMVDGENVIYVGTDVESLLAFDRPMCWAEHATIGSPFLVPGKTVVDMSGGASRTRPYSADRAGVRRLTSGQQFWWPNAPALESRRVDLRAAPAGKRSMDHTATMMDAARKLAFVTALNTEKRLLLGYVFRREEFPWVQNWENYETDTRMARGLEFSTQPYDVPRREAIETNSMLGAPTYRWLPAKAKAGAAFLMFYTHAPEGFTKVDDVRLENGQLIIEDASAGKKITLAASRGL